MRRINDLNIAGMSCASCEKTLHRNLIAVDGVLDVVVTRNPGIARVTYDDARISLHDLAARVQEVGFDFKGLARDHADEK